MVLQLQIAVKLFSLLPVNQRLSFHFGISFLKIYRLLGGQEMSVSFLAVLDHKFFGKWVKNSVTHTIHDLDSLANSDIEWSKTTVSSPKG